MATNVPAQMPKYCQHCEGVMDPRTLTCPHCGLVQTGSRSLVGISDKKIMPVGIICFLFGVFGAHRFYVGKTGTAIFQLCTLGGAGIWALVDLIIVVTGNFTDGDGNKIVEWT